MAVCTVDIENVEKADYGMLSQVFSHVVAWHAPQATHMAVYCYERRENGWLEYATVLTFHSGNKLSVYAIQRSLGGEYEFHS